MAFLIDEAYLPATLTAPPMSDQQFAEFCAQHPDLSFEVTAEGFLIVMPPNFTLTGARNSEIDFQLRGWAKQDKRESLMTPAPAMCCPMGPDARQTLRGLPKPESVN